MTQNPIQKPLWSTWECRHKLIRSVGDDGVNGRRRASSSVYTDYATGINHPLKVSACLRNPPNTSSFSNQRHDLTLATIEETLTSGSRAASGVPR
jgi:hypothetical protein